jgi:hypothetical protein
MSMTVRAAPIYVGPLKVAELTEATVTFKANGELIITIEEVVKSKGVVTTEVTADTVVPFGGLTVDMVGLLIHQTEVQVGVLTNGTYYTVTGTFDEASIKTMVKSGSTTGSFKFSGGTPQA